MLSEYEAAGERGGAMLRMTGERIKYEPEIRDLTVGELLDAVGMSSSTFYRRLSEDGEFYGDDKRRILDYLGIYPLMEEEM